MVRGPPFAIFWCAAILAGYEFPWVMTLGSPASDTFPASGYDISAALADLNKPKAVPEGPRLVSRTYSRLIVSRGSSVTLNCTVEDASDVSVTWTRDKEVLTVDKFSLRFSQVMPEDSGIFQCHVGTDPEQVARVKLVVIDAYSVIFGSSEVSVAVGGTLYLLCLVLQVTDIPEYILWYHNQKVIDYSRSSISVKTDEETRSSELRVWDINYTDAGNYTCEPSNAAPAFVSITVFKDTNKKSGRTEKCDECVLYIQLGATFAFFTLSFLIAFCIHSRDNTSRPWLEHSLSEDLYVPPDYDKSL
ncbi:Basement membrane-specific heparan sulfate proteoglycan core protein-like 1 [Homarus americanus]|uniref:Basement membrane-specific heparan sulfate proteoglycan core protein-like 1 n=1 Tax=Homarus americanus TaxID=6706 RepID=A0A8J5N981_HOMAM|nr:Basement membrane-specific heparan sulfate proteoglycan core protein-like 1 [Homarus americanus]